jgi:hypothetical protein
MKLLKMFGVAAVFMLALSLGAAAQDGKSKSSKKAEFATVSSSDASYKDAVDAKDLTKASAMVGKEGTLRGTVAKVYTPKSGAVMILNFARDYKTAVTAVVKKSNFDKFPNLDKLEGAEIIVSGKFADFKGATEVEITSPDQIKIVK